MSTASTAAAQSDEKTVKLPDPPSHARISLQRRRRRCHSRKSRFSCQVRLYKIPDEETESFPNDCFQTYINKFESYPEGERCEVEYTFREPFMNWLRYCSVKLCVRALRIEYIDRGVKDLQTFAFLLQSTFPNLEFLMWSQNYGSQDIVEFMRDDFVQKLKHVCISDAQSNWKSDVENLQNRGLCAVPGASRHLHFRKDNGGDEDDNPVFVFHMQRAS